MKGRGAGCSNLVFIFLFAMGLVWLGLTLRGMQLAKQSADWLSVSGKIETTWVEEDSNTDAEDTITYTYIPHVRYSYTVGETSYTSERLNFGNVRSYGNESSARSFLNTYPIGSEVEVFYDPADPGEAVLVREASGSTASIIGASVMILISIVGAVGLLLKRRKASSGVVLG